VQSGENDADMHVILFCAIFNYHMPLSEKKAPEI
jgi:hypothetical protein